MKALIFGGTTEGRKLSRLLSKSGIDVTLSVATEYGWNLAENAAANILSDRLGKAEMTAMLDQGAFDIVIDATHPYAVEVTKNIRFACQAAATKYYRLKRPESAEIEGITYVPDASAAAEIINKSNEKVMLAIGSKELKSFTQAENYAERFFVRILPMLDSLQKALELGFRGSNIICMQGPFDMEMNMATLKMTGAKCLVTKDSGDAGGTEAKVSAALSVGCEVIMIGRPVQEEGYTLNELLEIVGAAVKETENPENTAHFPLFVNMRGKKVLVIGGGNVAERRVRVLSSFGADITVISPEISETIKQLASCCLRKKYQPGDIAAIKPFLVLTAADDRQANHEAMLEAKSFDIHISVADCREQCTFYFPAIAENESFIVGLVSKNGDHSGVKRTAEKIRRLL